MSFFSISTQEQLGKNDLPPESLSEYYEDRKKIIFNKLTITNNEQYILSLLKKSQQIVNQKTTDCLKGGFFQLLASNVYSLSVSYKENVSNYCLVISLYLKENRKLDALKLFLILSEQNKKTVNFLSMKILEQLPKISNTNKIAQYYPTITKTCLQVISVLIKLSGKFNKYKLERFYIEHYLKIAHVLSNTVVKYITPGKIDEINTQLRNERRYFYSNCLFDCAIYLFNRYHPLNLSISIFTHILDIYTNININFLNEIELILLLKLKYNLSLFYYSDGLTLEAITNMNQAKERVLDIKYFPVSKMLKSRISLNEEELMMNKLRSNNNKSSNLLLDLNELVIPVNHSSRNKIKRNSIKVASKRYNDKDSIEQKSSFYMKISEENTKSQINIKNVKIFSSIYLGANNILKFKNPLELEIVREKILIEIELILAEMELKNKNYKESLNHLNFILNLQKNSNLAEQGLLNKDTIGLTKTKTNSSQNEFESFETKTTDKNRFFLNYKKNVPENNNTLFLFSRNKSSNNYLKENSSINNISNSQIMKYNLTNGDKSRIMRLLEEIEISRWENDGNISKNKNQYIEESKYSFDKNKNYLIRKQKIITSKEMEKFFIFICNLSIYQLKILNDTQPPPSRRRNDLPIIFNNQFQDCLTNSQRMTLSLLETMSLSRYILLKNTNKDISLDNLDFRFMLYQIKEKETDEEGNNIINNNKVKNNNNIFRRNRNNKGVSFRSNTLNLKSSKKNVKKFEYEEEDSAIKFFMKNNSNKNKKLIGLHKKGVVKLLEEMNKDEQKIFYKNPELLTKLIEDTEKDMKK